MFEYYDGLSVSTAATAYQYAQETARRAHIALSAAETACMHSKPAYRQQALEAYRAAKSLYESASRLVYLTGEVSKLSESV